jgi:hypothetical protein
MTVALAIACVLVTGNCSPVTAQVAIGGDGTVTPGALLDLSQATDAGGLLLPQIVSADTTTAVLRKPGMLVYNKTDGKIYAYNGSAWSAGGGSGGSGGGGGGEPDPTPSPTSCSGSVMGVSGTVYPIGSYPYAQNDLKNLCWTLTNLQEAGASRTSYDSKAEVRGYYYTKEETYYPEDNVCKRALGSAWRVPTRSEWGLLVAGTDDLTLIERQDWCAAPAALAGYDKMEGTVNKWNGWNEQSVYKVSTDFALVAFDSDMIFAGWTYLSDTKFGQTINKMIYATSVRCVRDL